MTDRPITINHAVLCDDVRREDNGKLIFIGVYARDIRVDSLPANLTLYLSVMLDARHIGETSVEVKAQLDENEVISGRLPINVSEEGKAYIVFGRMPLVLPNEGRLVFRVRPEGQKWVEVWSGQFAKR